MYIYICIYIYMQTFFQNSQWEFVPSADFIRPLEKIQAVPSLSHQQHLKGSRFHHPRKVTSRIARRFWFQRFLIFTPNMGGNDKLWLYNPRWWFQQFFIFTPIPANSWSNLTFAYFSNGVAQPPTSIDWINPRTPIMQRFFHGFFHGIPGPFFIWEHQIFTTLLVFGVEIPVLTNKTRGLGHPVCVTLAQRPWVQQFGSPKLGCLVRWNSFFFPKQLTVGVLNATLDLAALVLVGVVGFLGS